MKEQLKDTAVSLVFDGVKKKLNEVWENYKWRELFVETGDFFVKDPDRLDAFEKDLAVVFSEENMVILGKQLENMSGYDLPLVLKVELGNLMKKHEIPHLEAEAYSNYFIEVIIKYIEDNNKGKSFEVHLGQFKREMDKKLSRLEVEIKSLKKGDKKVLESGISRHSVKLRSNAISERYLELNMEEIRDTEYENFQNQINIVHTNINETWKQGVLELLSEECIDRDDEFNNSINFVRGNETYEVILNTLQKIYSKYMRSIACKEKLSEYINEPRFNKVFLVSGEFGSGKSFFVYNFIKFSIEKEELIVIPVTTSRLLTEESIEDIMFDALNSVLGSEHKRGQNFNEILKKVSNKICFIVEDIEEVYIRDKDKFIRFINTIKIYTKYDNINWLISVDESEFFIFDIVPQFRKRYCYGDTNSNNSYNMFANSFYLNEYNFREGIVKQILDSYGVKIIQDAILEEIIEEASLEVPLFAHILGRCCKGEEILFPETSLAYIETVTGLLNESISKCKDADKLVETQKNILALMEKTRKVEFDENELGQVKEEFLNSLEALHLVSYIIRKESDVYCLNQFVEQKVYRLKVEVFWAFKYVVEQIMQDEHLAKNLLPFTKKFRDILVPCHLMIVDNKGMDSSSVIKVLFSEGVGYYPLFCSKKTSITFQNKLFEYLVSDQLQSDVKTIYSLLYYLEHSKLKMNDKFRLISINARRIVEVELIDMCVGVVHNIVYQIQKINILMESIAPLINCCVNDINCITGYSCGRRYYEILKEENGVMNDNVFTSGLLRIHKFIGKNQKAKKMIDIHSGANKSFMDYFIRSYFECCLQNIELKELFGLMRERDFFSSYDGKYFKRNFTCAAGNIFSQRKGFMWYEISYEELVNELSRSKKRYDNLTALFLVLNSMKNEDDDIRDCLKPAFKRLWKIEDIKTNYRDHAEVKKILRSNGLK